MSDLATQPYPVRLWKDDNSEVADLSRKSGVPKAELIRRLFRYGLEQYTTGKIEMPPRPPSPGNPGLT